LENKRISFGSIDKAIEIPDLLDIQRKSFDWFIGNEAYTERLKNADKTGESLSKVSGLKEVFNDFSPFEFTHGAGANIRSNIRLFFRNVFVDEPKYTIEECRRKKLNYAADVYAEAELIEELEDGTRPEPKRQTIRMCELPLMTKNGTFVINGAERVVISQIMRSPGPIFYEDEVKETNGSYKKVTRLELNPNRGRRLSIDIDQSLLSQLMNLNKYIDLDAFIAKKEIKVLDKEFDNIVKALEGMISKVSSTSKEKKVRLQDVKKALNGTLSDVLTGVTDYKTLPSKTLVTSSKVDIKTVLNDILRRIYDKCAIVTIGTGVLKVGIVELLIILGFPDEATIQKTFADSTPIVLLTKLTRMFNYTTKDVNYFEEIVKKSYTKVTNMSTRDVNFAYEYFSNMFFNEDRYHLTSVGRYKLDVKLGMKRDKMLTALDLNDVVAVVKYLTQLSLLGDRQTAVPDFKVTDEVMKGIEFKTVPLNLDDNPSYPDLSSYRICNAGEALQTQFREGLTRFQTLIQNRDVFVNPALAKKEAAAVEKLVEKSGKSVKKDEKKSLPVQLTPRDILRNMNVLQASITHFFNSSQFSQFVDQNNPLAGLANSRRISAIGAGGLGLKVSGRVHSKERGRDLHPTHYGRICPIESPEGPNAGLVTSFASFARLNEYGFIETPYRRVVNAQVTDEIVWLDALSEKSEVIAQAKEPVDKNGKFTGKTVLARNGKEGGDPDDVHPTDVTFIDASSHQMVSIGTSLIPFLEHDDAHRAMMGANMQRQAVPLLKSEAPLVGTGAEYRVAIDSGEVICYSSDFETDKKKIEKGGVVQEVHDTVCVIKGDNGKKYTFESRKFQRSNAGTCINNVWLVNEGDRVEVGAPLADGPATKDAEIALGQNLLVAYMNFDGYNFEDAIIISSRLVQDDTLTSVHIEDYDIAANKTKIGDEIITRDIPNVGEDSLRNLNEDGVIRVGAEIRPGDILVGKLSPKGEKSFQSGIEKIFGGIGGEMRNASLTVPNGVFGTVIGVEDLSQEKGDLPLSTDILRKIKVYIATSRKIGPGDKLAGRHGNKGVISTVLPVEDMPFLEDGTPVDIILNPLGVPGRMNIGQILEAHLGWVAKQGWNIDDDKSKNDAWKQKLNENAKKVEPNQVVGTPAFDGVEEEVLEGLLRCYNVNEDGDRLVGEDGKARLIDGRTGEPFPERIAVGYMYALKLHHLVEDKVHARSTGPNAIITNQPLGGKAQFGGQRLGKMEAWALEAYGASSILHEMLTIKSDDYLGSRNAYRSIVRGENIASSTIPETFKVMRHELTGLRFDVDITLDENSPEVQMRMANRDEVVRA
jgi:DNA-directed RNA polymerase subunit beta